MRSRREREREREDRTERKEGVYLKEKCVEIGMLGYFVEDEIFFSNKMEEEVGEKYRRAQLVRWESTVGKNEKISIRQLR